MFGSSKKKEYESIVQIIDDPKYEEGKQKKVNLNLKKFTKDIHQVISRLIKGRKRLVSLFEDIFTSAFLVSSYDLKMKFFGNRIRSVSSKVSNISHEVHNLLNNSHNAVSVISSANS